MNTRCRYTVLVWLILSARLSVAADDYSNSIQSFLQQNFDHKNFAMVVGVVDENGSRIYCAGTLGNGTDQEVNGDPVFKCVSVTKPFTALLLEEMVARGEMKLDDPVSKYLPESVTMPTHGGKEI